MLILIDACSIDRAQAVRQLLLPELIPIKVRLTYPFNQNPCSKQDLLIPVFLKDITSNNTFLNIKSLMDYGIIFFWKKPQKCRFLREKPLK